MEICRLGGEDELVLDVTNLSAGEAAERILTLSGGECQVADEMASRAGGLLGEIGTKKHPCRVALGFFEPSKFCVPRWHRLHSKDKQNASSIAFFIDYICQ